MEPSSRHASVPTAVSEIGRAPAHRHFHEHLTQKWLAGMRLSGETRQARA